MQKNEYARRVNAALDLIDANLGEELSLKALAAAAHFSPFHFHRIFFAFVGETPADYVRRLRLEKAAGLLLFDPGATVTEIALGCGFATSALFCRRFRSRFGMTPTAWRQSEERYCKIGQTARKNGKDRSALLRYPGSAGSKIPDRRQKMKKKPVVRIEDIPAWRVAYVKHMKGYEDQEGIGNAFQTLFCWAGPRGVASPEMRVMGMSLDNPEITPKDKCRYFACLTVTERAKPEGEVGIMNIRPGKYAIGRFEGGRDVFKKSYDYMYGQWLPNSGYQPDDAPAFESYVGEPSGTEKRPHFVFDLYVPLKPL